MSSCSVTSFASARIPIIVWRSAGCLVAFLHEATCGWRMQRVNVMSKKLRRGNREARKPKQVKPAVSATPDFVSQMNKKGSDKRK